jgi:DNA repair protein RecN (Recombination protein N)
MLSTLRIKNLALVTDLTLELQPGYNVITGETGAGKSIIIGALNLVLGERADRTLIRSGEESCSVEAVFDASQIRAPLKSFLEENGLEPCEDGQLVLKRTFNVSGTNRQFINGSPTSLNVLARLGEWLVDMHGPHDHQSLLLPAKQLDLLDAFGDVTGERAAFAELVHQRNSLLAKKAALIVDEKTYAQQLDLLRFQVKEIEAARLQPDEEVQIEQDHKRSSNAARLLQLSQAALDILSESESSLFSQAGVIGRTLQELHRVDGSAAPLLELHEQGVSAFRDLQASLSSYADKVDVDPQRLQELEERLNLIHSLKRKYGVTLAEVIAFGEDVKQKLESLEGRDEELARINLELEKLNAKLRRAGEALTAKRKKVAPQFGKAAARQLGDLGFKQSKFDIAISTTSFGDEITSLKLNGFDDVEFQFAPNLGEPPKPLRAIASSGEMARVMLALKTVLAAVDDIPVLIFDEVDANVGGETANAVGEKMKQIATKHQVLCITHLPQVAAPADAHYLVSKVEKNGRTISEINLMDRTQRLTELARMLGGQSDAARKHAEALLK